MARQLIIQSIGRHRVFWWVVVAASWLTASTGLAQSPDFSKPSGSKGDERPTVSLQPWDQPIVNEPSDVSPVRTRQRIFVRLPDASSAGGGELQFEPSVQVVTEAVSVFDAGRDSEFYQPGTLSSQTLGVSMIQAPGAGEEILPPGGLDELPVPLGGPAQSYDPGPFTILEGEIRTAEPIFEDIVSSYTKRSWEASHRFWHALNWGNHPAGVGRERLPLAPFEIDASQPFTNFGVQTYVGWSRQFPDRAAYFWAAPPLGPPDNEVRLNYQELRLRSELGSANFSVTTEVPFRWTDPLRNGNHAGLSDLSVATKLVMVNGESWQVTQFFKTYFNTGAPSAGLGTGHISLEPGVLFRHKWDENKYLHSQIKYWFPVGADPLFAGQVLTYGLGTSVLLHDTDRYAAIPTLEFVGWSVLNGLQTAPFPAGAGDVLDVDGTHILNFFPGIRFVFDSRGDFGLLELGLRGGFPVTDERWEDGSIRVDIRWSY